MKDISWLPLELVNNVKIILTVSSESFVLKSLLTKINSHNFLPLTPFTQEQWEDVLTYGGGAANGAMQLPDSWKKSDERAPIQAKVCQLFHFVSTWDSMRFFRSCGGWRGSGSGKWKT